MKELSSDWKGKIMFPCHVVYDCASITNSTSITDSPPIVNICDYVGGQVYNAKRLYLSPTDYPPPTSTSDMLSSKAHLCMGWVKLCRKLIVAAHESGSPIVCNGSHKSNPDNRVFWCGMLYQLTRPPTAMQISTDHPLQTTTLINDRKNNRVDGIHGLKHIKTMDQRNCTCSFCFLVMWQTGIVFFIELEKCAGELFHCFHQKV